MIKPIFHKKTQKKHRDLSVTVNVTNFGLGLQENGLRYQPDFFCVKKFGFSTTREKYLKKCLKMKF